MPMKEQIWKRAVKQEEVLRILDTLAGYTKKAKNYGWKLQIIYKQYDIDSIETIYISGDGVSQIRTGLDWILKSRFVLDKYHLRKYMLSATAHLKKVFCILLFPTVN